MPSRTLTLRRSDRCAGCATELAVGSRARWDAEARTVTCLDCRPASAAPPPADAPEAPTTLERGAAGASAAREHARRKRNREQRSREAHPRLGGLLLATRDEPQHEVAFHVGARGEEAVARALERPTADRPTVLLHDRRMPRGHGNIDHLAIAPAGVFVIDAKAVHGKVTVATPFVGPSRLLVGRRDRTKLVDGLDRQVAAVRAALAAAAPAWPVHGALCFTQADLPLLRTMTMRSHLLAYPKALAKRLNAQGPFSAEQIDAMARTLAKAFAPA